MTKNIKKRRSVGGAVSGGLAGMLLLGLLTTSICGMPIVSADSAEIQIDLDVDLVLTMTPSSGTNIPVPLTPTTGSAYSVRKFTVGVSTNNTTGYTMTFSMGSSQTALVNSANGGTIPSTSGSVSTPSAIELNAWGFAVPKVQANSAGLFPSDINGFDNNYSEITSGATLAENYAGLPSSGSPLTLKTTTAPSNMDNTEFYFGARVDIDVPAGSYGGAMTFSAVANYVP